MSATPSRFLDYALALRRYQRRTRLTMGLLAAALAAAVTQGLLLLLAVVAAPLALRLGVLGAGVLAALAAVAWTIRLVRTTPSLDRTAVLVEERFPGLQDRYVTAVEIALSLEAESEPWAAASVSHTRLANRAIEQAQVAVRELDLREAIDTRTARRLALGVAALTLLLAGSAAVFPRAWAGLLTAPERPATAAFGPFESAPQVEPLLGPSIADVTLKLDYPAYTRQPAETRTADLESVSAIVGTQVTITSTVSGERASVACYLNGRAQELGVGADRRVVARLTLSRDTTWELRATDQSGRVMGTPPCRLRAIPDRAPQIALTEPGKNTALRDLRPVRLAYRATDDWGLNGISLEYRAPDQTHWQTVSLAGAAGRALSDAWSWDLRPLRLTAGQSVAYRLAAVDNDAVSGPKTSRTPIYTITVGSEPPPREGVASPAAEQAAQHESEDLDQLEKEAEELGRQLDELISAVEKGELTEPERARRSAELNEAQRRVAEQADRLSRALAETERQAAAERLAPELQEKMRELHDLLEETMNKDLAEALKEIERSLQSMNQDELQASLERARQSQQNFAEQLQQAIELLKRARLERNLDHVAGQADQLAADQEKLNQEREQLRPDQPEKARRQGDAQQELEQREGALENALDEVAQDAAQVDRKIGDRLGEISRQLRQSGAGRNMQDAAQKLQQGKPAEAAEPQQMALSDLSQAAGSLRQLQGETSAGSQQQLSRAAQEMTRDALYLSRGQERVMGSTGSIDTFSARSAAQGKAHREGVRREQEALESGARQLGEKLGEIAKSTPLIDPALARRAEDVANLMGRAAREASGGAGPQAVQTQREAMSGLNALAEELIRASENMQQAAQAAATQGLMQQLLGLAQQQRALNQQTQQAQGQGSTPRKEGSQGQLADEQARIREALERLLQKAGKPSGLPDQLGDVPGQMNDVEQDLREDRLGSQTVARQHEVLRRMLDAQRSVYQKDQQRRQRIAERPKPFRLPPSPPELTPRSPPQSRAELTPGEETELPLDYEDVVRQYFRALAEMP